MSDAAHIGRRTAVVPPTANDGDMRSSTVGLIVVVGFLAGVGAWLARTRRRNLDTMTRAVARHPVITATVGGLLLLTGLSLSCSWPSPWC